MRVKVCASVMLAVLSAATEAAEDHARSVVVDGLLLTKAERAEICGHLYRAHEISHGAAAWGSEQSRRIGCGADIRYEDIAAVETERKRLSRASAARTAEELRKEVDRGVDELRVRRQRDAKLIHSSSEAP